MSTKTGCGDIRAQPEGISGGHSGGQLLPVPRALHDITVWPWPAPLGDTDVLLPDPVNLPLPSVALAEAQGCLLSALLSLGSSWGFPGCSDGKESACNTGSPGSIPRLGKIPWRREWLPTLVFCPGEFHGPRSLVGHSPWAHNESDTTEPLTAGEGAFQPHAGGFNTPSPRLEDHQPSFTQAWGDPGFELPKVNLKEEIQIWNFTRLHFLPH